VVRTRGGAPGELELVRAFVNTAGLEDGVDGLSDPAALTAWLRGRDLLASGDAASGDEYAVAVAVREALRDLAGANGGRPVPAESMARLDAVAAACGLRPRFDAGGAVSLAPDVGGVPGALGRMLGIVVAAIGAGRWERMKTCRNPACRWAFYDATRNRSAVWCDMAACGGRAKSRAYYARGRASARQAAE
jgi:predicted RNA-binding Zn ribbon-like protein